MAGGVGFELGLVRVDDLAAAVLALQLGHLSAVFGGGMPSWHERAYNRGWLRRLDRQTVGLDGRAGTSLVGFLVLALNLCMCKRYVRGLE